MPRFQYLTRLVVKPVDGSDVADDYVQDLENLQKFLNGKVA